MDVTNPFDAKTRRAWRRWLEVNHAKATEVWLLWRRDVPGTITYLDAVEEALCFGWIDGLAKKYGDATAQRFTPRRPKGNWTELNKDRMRRLIAAGKMTPAGLAVAPDLSDVSVRVAPDVRQKLEKLGAWAFFSKCPPAYQRIRLGYVEEVRKRDPKEFEKRLSNFLEKTAKGQLFGNWDDSGLPRTGD